MQKECVYSVLDEQKSGYTMVSGHVEHSSTRLPRMWRTSTTLQSDVHLAYHYKRKLSEFEESSRKLYDILYAMSSIMGVWESDSDEDL
jgi:hypothetical protein